MKDIIRDKVNHMIYGYISSQILFVADSIDLFNVISQEDTLSLDQICETLKTDKDATERILIGLSALEIIEKKSGKYRVSHVFSKYLMPNCEGNIGELIPHFRDVSFEKFKFLVNIVKHGKNSVSSKLGAKHDPFDSINKDKEKLALFHRSMWGLGYSASLEHMAHFSLSDVENLVDIGGGIGSFTIAALQKNPTLKATIFDKPEVEDIADYQIGKYKLNDRADFVSGDIFKDVLPEADAYSIGYILSDWDQPDCEKILQKIHDSLPPGGSIIVLEKFFNEDKTGPFETAVMNLAMLVETNGCHRTELEYYSLLRKIGFNNLKTFYSSTGKNMIIGYKAKA